ncbi:type II secretion system F family protein [Arthrobacter sp. STN4]|uniref:type II secretion system F family protein n=1 Tax=Arthrobacter sp. STN4 TaxID=2923276 RepID=UPI002119FD4A|nr:type II secretion system F family protein [Arthrobacter sp. STN4]MCQ9163594.1 type II secretion system F family protein [Arthrobacter sp. STN4]
MSPAMIVVGVLLCLAALLLVVFVVFKPKHGRVSKDRLGTRQPGSKAKVDKKLGQVTESTVEAINGFLDRRGVRYTTGTALELAGIKTRPADFIIWVGAATAVAAVAFFLLDVPVLSFFMLPLVPLLAWAFVRIKTERRRSAFNDQLGDTLQLLTGGLRAGHSMMHAIDAAATDSDTPMSEELARVVNETRLGRDTGDSLLSTAERMHSEDFNWVAQAIEINREAGGDLADVLDHVGDTIRDRGQIRRQVEALSAEGRMSALVLFCLPFGVGGIMFFMNPTYFSVLFQSLLGIALIVVVAVLLGIGALWLRAVVKIKF